MVSERGQLVWDTIPAGLSLKGKRNMKSLSLVTSIAVDWDNDEGVEDTDIVTSHKFENPDEIESIQKIHDEKVSSFIVSLVKKSDVLEAISEGVDDDE